MDPRFLGLRHVALNVRDVRRSLAFYSSVLGMTLEWMPDDENAYLESHSWEEYARWHLGLTDGAKDHTKARYAFVYGDFRRLHRMGIIACQYRAAEWRHKDIELAAHELLQCLDSRKS